MKEWDTLLVPEKLLGMTPKKKVKKEEKVKLAGRMIALEGGVLCASDPDKKVYRCLGCVQRERRTEERKKKSQGINEAESLSVEEEQSKLLQFYCAPRLDFSFGEVILPTRITCYCRHHDEKEGFQIWIKLRDVTTNTVIASEVSSVVLITDDHKSPKSIVQSISLKRPRSSPELDVKGFFFF